MSNFNEKSFTSLPMVCGICLIDNNLIQLDEDNNIFNVFILITKIRDLQENKIPSNICTACFQELERVSQFIEMVKWKWNNSQNIIIDDVHCLVCFGSTDLILLAHNLFAVFQDLTNVMLNYKEKHSAYSCNKCLNKLQEVSDFITTYKQNQKLFKKKFIIKKEPLELSIKEESSDDEFVETPTKIVIKDEPEIFSFKDLETANNYAVKTEAILSAIEEVEYCEGKKNILKLEVDEEGIQYNCQDLMKVNCPFCNDFFSTTRGLLNHMKRFQCRHQKQSLHRKMSKPFKCQVCLKYFPTLQKKDEHIKNHFGKSYVICQMCGKIMIRQMEYFKHHRLHITKQLPVKCKLCPKKFLTKHLYHKHIHEHKKTANLKCKICFRTYSKELFKIHKSQIKMSCTYCTKQFCIKSRLVVHLRSHTGEKPFECAVCSHNFTSKGNLIKHFRIHTGFKPYSCKICLKRFSRPDYLNKHSLSIHKSIHEGEYKTGRKRKLVLLKNHKNTIEPEVMCNICSNVYPSKQSLVSHMRVHNKEKNFKCEICSKTFLYKGLLTGHMKTHQDNKPFACTICPKSFIKRNDLTRHTFTHTKEKNYRCEICFEKFSRKDVLRLHLRGHTGQKPYKCDQCLKTFAQKSNLTHHIKRCKACL